MSDKYPFLGTGWDFPPTFSKGERTVKMISDEKDIASSLEILLSTTIGERVMQPTYGCNLKNLLFEPLDTTLQTYIKDMIKKAILYHEARIKLDKIELDVEQYEGRLTINLDYTIKTTNSRYNFVYPFYLKEGTDINQ